MFLVSFRVILTYRQFQGGRLFFSRARTSMYRAFIFSAFLLSAISGCSEGGPSVQYVEGVVTLDGNPVEGATVSFSAADGKGSGAVGITDASGVYKLTALPDGAAGAGAATGDYLVTISKVTVSGGGVTSSEDPNYGKISAGKSEPPKAVKVIPEKYESTSTSGFKATVKPGSNKGDEFKFDCKSS